MRALREERTTMLLRNSTLNWGAALLSLGLLTGGAAAQPSPGPLFPEPFRVAHRLIQEDGDGTRFEGEPVVDTYGGSWIVSQRPDGTRVIVDLVRRELTEVRPDKGTYWTVSFDRFAELQSRMRELRTSNATALAGAEKTPAEKEARPQGGVAPPSFELEVTEEPGGVATKTVRGARAGNALGAESPIEGPAAKPGVRHLRVARKGAPAGEAALEVWVDPSVHLTPAAVVAIAALESETLAAPAGRDKSTPLTVSGSPGRFLAAARAQGAGALPVRSVRPAATDEGGLPQGRIEDVATKVERLERFPNDLVEIPEGMRRTPHPLEAVVRFLEEEAERNAAMAGRGAGQKP